MGLFDVRVAFDEVIRFACVRCLGMVFFTLRLGIYL